MTITVRMNNEYIQNEKIRYNIEYSNDVSTQKEFNFVTGHDLEFDLEKHRNYLWT